MKLVAVLAGVALLGATPALAAPSKKTVRVGDNFFSPKKLTVDRKLDGHVEVAGLRRGRGRPRRRADLGPEGRQEVPVRGRGHGLLLQAQAHEVRTYKLVCTLHEEMRMTIKVRS